MNLLCSLAKVGRPARWMPRGLMLMSVALLLTGCTSTPMVGLAGPVNEEELRDLATRYIRSAFHFPDHPGVRAQAVEAAEDLGPEWLPLIRGALRDEQPAVRFAA